MTEAFEADEPVGEKYIREFMRFGRTKLHNVSAYLGGVAGQECTKLIMSQFVPLNHTFIFDGIHCRGQAFKV
jgi:hypothetical protein